MCIDCNHDFMTIQSLYIRYLQTSAEFQSRVCHLHQCWWTSTSNRLILTSVVPSPAQNHHTELHHMQFYTKVYINITRLYVGQCMCGSTGNSQGHGGECVEFNLLLDRQQITPETSFFRQSIARQMRTKNKGLGHGTREKGQWLVMLILVLKDQFRIPTQFQKWNPLTSLTVFGIFRWPIGGASTSLMSFLVKYSSSTLTSFHQRYIINMHWMCIWIIFRQK